MRKLFVVLSLVGLIACGGGGGGVTGPSGPTYPNVAGTYTGTLLSTSTAPGYAPLQGYVYTTVVVQQSGASISGTMTVGNVADRFTGTIDTNGAVLRMDGTIPPPCPVTGEAILDKFSGNSYIVNQVAILNCAAYGGSPQVTSSVVGTLNR